ncbi:MAG TPA: uL13 family ribosomal protein, partial [Nitrospira sp.]|nr:uL13 family ribosomal protein [Nitrospira sp.]
TGNKMENKTYSTHSGFPGGLKTLTAEHIHRKDPTKLLTKAIEGMLPKNPLGNHMAKKLRVYAGTTHPHQAQKLESLSL